MQTTQIINQLDRVRILESFTPANERMKPIVCGVAFATSPAHIERLLYRLQNAHPVSPTMVPKDIVTMNSIVRICNQATLAQQRVALIYPTDEPQGLPVGVKPVGIQTELGSELLGRRLGEAFTVTQRSIPIDYRVSAIEYQPEAAGDFDR